ncbi:MAG: hypothetical protein J1E77_09780 [Prevotella sp.]|nr:hypothetical protein [Prevotella sp.]
MTKSLRLFGVSFFVSAMALGFVACGGSDDEDLSDGVVSSMAGLLDKESGLRVKKAGDYTYNYSDNGRIQSATAGSYTSFQFGYNPNYLSFQETWQGEVEDEGYYRLVYNVAGLLAGMTYSSDGIDDNGYRETNDSEATVAYSGGRISKVSITGSGSYYEDGYRITWTATGMLTFTWANSRLVKVTWERDQRQADERYHSTEEWNYDYNDGVGNAYLQYTPSLTLAIEEDMDIFAYVGLLGEGSAQLPSSATYSEEVILSAKEEYTSEKSYNFRYGFNKNGSVSYTYVDSNRYDFKYDYADTRAAAQEESQEQATKGKRPFRLFQPLRRSSK